MNSGRRRAGNYEGYFKNIYIYIFMFETIQIMLTKLGKFKKKKTET